MLTGDISRLVERALADVIGEVLKKTSSLYIFRPRSPSLDYFFIAKNYIRMSLDFYLVTIGVVEPGKHPVLRKLAPGTGLLFQCISRRRFLSRHMECRGPHNLSPRVAGEAAAAGYEVFEALVSPEIIEVYGGERGSVVIRGRTGVFSTLRPVEKIRRIYRVNEEAASYIIRRLG